MQNGDINRTSEWQAWIFQSKKNFMKSKGCHSAPFFCYISMLYTKLILIRLANYFYTQKTFQNQRQFLVVLVLLILSFAINTYSQNPEPIYRKYNVDNGMPSSVVYHAFQDSKGYIWFATTNGVSRFDGYKFENFDLQSGLVDNDVFEIYEDYKGRIWFVPITGKLAYFQNGKIYSYKYNNRIKENVKFGKGPIKLSFYIDSIDNVYLSILHFGKIRISPEGIYKKYSGVFDVGDLFAEELSNGRVFVTCPGYSEPFDITFQGKFQNFKFSSDSLFGHIANSYRVFFWPQPDSSMVFSVKGELFKTKNGKIISRRAFGAQEIIWCSYVDSILWVAPFDGGIFGYVNSDIKNEPKYKFLKQYQVSSVLKDSEGSYWFTTLNDGAFYCPNINFLTLTSQSGLSDDRVNALYANKNGLFIGYNNKFIDFLNDSIIYHVLQENTPLELSNISKIIEDTTLKKLWICSMLYLHSTTGNETGSKVKSNFKDKIYPRDIVKSKSGDYWIGTNKGLIKYDGKKIIYESYGSVFDPRDPFRSLIYSLVEDNVGTVWFCTMNGLWKYSNDTYQYLGTENPLLAQNGSSLIINPLDSCLWFGTNGLGIVVYGKDTIYQISQKQGLASNSIRRLYYSSNEVWAATRQGVSRISFKGDKYTIKNYTVSEGLPSNEITSIAIRNRTVYVGTSKGLCKFNPDAEGKIVFQPNIIITKFSINNQVVDSIRDGIKLEYNQNLLNFDFVGFVYKNNGAIQYQYRMLGLDTNWVSSNNPSCLFSGLSNGTYTFEVRSQNSEGFWNPRPAQISFTILPPIWKKWWFMLILSFLFASLLFGYYRYRVASIHQKNELLHNINLYKQQSLRQQMNPHFIFNTLNSIQLYILEKDPISSHKYLTKFAKLMRMTLDNSLNSTIPLRDEIEALKIYLELEKIRLEGKFEYSINLLSEESILNVKIPTLLIQPFVENAIWHGIMLKENQSGWVRISLIEENSIVNCIIEDNGVGRVQADAVRRIRNKEHKSRGSQITQQRIELLSLMYKEKFNIQYEDLTDEFGIAAGTKVLISIPKGIKANIQK
jgi:ligand-binding sensor domain-containing protein